MTLLESIKMNCHQATALVQKKAEGKITFSERVGLFVHLSFCSLCKLFFVQTEMISKQVRELRKTESRNLSVNSKQRIEKVVNEQIQKHS
jgi:hypothetical protein